MTNFNEKTNYYYYNRNTIPDYYKTQFKELIKNILKLYGFQFGNNEIPEITKQNETDNSFECDLVRNKDIDDIKKELEYLKVKENKKIFQKKKECNDYNYLNIKIDQL
jgi:hypothetical protein